jgi:hypothetical protein
MTLRRRFRSAPFLSTCVPWPTRESGAPLTEQSSPAPLPYSVERDGNTLRSLIDNPPFLPGCKSRTTLTKVESPDASLGSGRSEE